MRFFATVYFEKIDPYYKFLDRDDIFHRIDERWLSSFESTALYAPCASVLAGVAAMGALFSQQKDGMPSFVISKIGFEEQLTFPCTFDGPHHRLGFACLLSTRGWHSTSSLGSQLYVDASHGGGRPTYGVAIK